MDFTKLRYWGLLEKTPQTYLYKLTSFGIAFIRGDKTIQRYKWIYNNAILPDPPDFENPLITFKDIKPKMIDKDTILANSKTLNRYIQEIKQKEEKQGELKYV